jgi:N-acetylglutamate synthase-like GNAT family acetyltransferase
MNTAVLRDYPRSLSFDESTVVIRLMTAADGPALTEFVQTLSARDLLFVRRDISHPKVIAAWLQALDQGNVTSLVACVGEAVVGCTAIVSDPLSWSRHVGDMRVLVAPDWRGCGLGRALIQECFALGLERGLEKLTVQMTVDQQAAVTVFEELGFRAEAVLHNHVKDHAGNAYDLALLSHDVAEIQGLMETLGVAEALSGER